MPNPLLSDWAVALEAMHVCAQSPQAFSKAWQLKDLQPWTDQAVIDIRLEDLANIIQGMLPSFP
jgi:hypothetical protein